MRVAIDARAIGPHFPGISRATLGLLRGLHELEHSLELSVILLPSQRALVEDSGVTRDARCTLVEVDAGPMAPRQQWQVARLARTLAPDVWHAPYYFRPFWGLPPTVVTIFDTIGPDDGRASHGMRGRLSGLSRRLLWRSGMRLSIQSAAHIITGSEAARHDLQRLYGRHLPHVTVIPLAVDQQFRPPSSEQVAHLRARIGLGKRYVVYVGSNKPHKNLGSLVQAWARLEHTADMCLIIAGREDPRYDSARVLSAQLGLGEHVRFLPDVPDADLPSLLGGAECFVFPSKHEGFGLPPLEAMACGTAVVVSNRSSLPEVVGDAGLLVEPEPGPLADAIQRLLADAALRQNLQARGLQRAAQFSWAATAAETLRVYRQVAM